MRLIRWTVAVVAVVVAVLVGPGVAPGTATAAPGDPVTFVFGRGVDDAVWLRVRDEASGAWRQWQSLGGLVTGTPYGELLPDGRLAVFARGVDGALWMRTSWDSITWTPWESLGGRLLDDPIVVFTPWVTGPGEGDVMVFARGVDFQPWVRSYVGTSATWSDWRRVSPQLAARPMTAWADEATRSVYVASISGPRPMQVIRLNAAGVVTSGYFLNNPNLQAMPELVGGQGEHVGFSWLPDRSLGGLDSSEPYWQVLGGVLKDAPNFGPTIGDLATALARGQDDAAWWHGPSGWTPLGGIVLESPHGADVDESRFLLAARGIDTAVWLRWWDYSTERWGAWETLGGLLRSAPSQLTVYEAGDAELASTSAGGYLPAGTARAASSPNLSAPRQIR